MDHSYAIQCLRTIHEVVSPIVVGLAQDRPIGISDRMAIRRLPSVSQEMLQACELPNPEIRTRQSGVFPEGAATRALCALLEKTTHMLSECARRPSPVALDNEIHLSAIHAIAWELVYALGLQGK